VLEIKSPLILTSSPTIEVMGNVIAQKLIIVGEKAEIKEI
jgi:cytoskeletal protein CcmA (bactofilin family)